MSKLAKFLRLQQRLRFHHKHDSKKVKKHHHHNNNVDDSSDNNNTLKKTPLLPVPPPTRSSSGSEDDTTVRMEDSSQSEMGGSCMSLLLSNVSIDDDDKVEDPVNGKTKFDKDDYEEEGVTLAIQEPQVECLVEEPQTSIRSSTSVKPSCKKKKQQKKTVSFQDVLVREYELILGDNPYCKYPLSLGWNYCTTRQVPVQDFEDARQDRLVQKAHDRIEPRLYVPPEGLGDPGNEAVAAYCDHYLPVHMEQDFNDTPLYKCVELDLQERRTRLRSYGHSEASLRQAERQRRVALAQEYVMGGDRDRDRDGPPNAAASVVASKTTNSANTSDSPAVSSSGRRVVVTPPLPDAVSQPQPTSLPFAYSPKFIQRYYL